eukprot:CAMPEP_0171381856 /NCGR_PEP_ID=MMETSP0879-20121228/32823_1 /TAXON_ID=67004 /ORGANISM="Thalassiosira weissflogii, Strain CCMP1336" /LENGTH=470 /DNA_ID=CAMNT_0011893447 /DNA_START=89 /DNA_END=1498 /DNA_ORIENTATION=-
MSHSSFHKNKPIFTLLALLLGCGLFLQNLKLLLVISRRNLHGDESIQHNGIPAKTNINSELPTCRELMTFPNSPFADGAFLTRRSTQISWKLRRDGSRELTLPSTCRLHRYSAAEAKECLKSKHLLFVGDSLTRYHYLSLAYFIEYGNWPKRFGASLKTPCKFRDEHGEIACSLPGKPNVCMEGDWNIFGGWPAFMQNLGGGTDGGIFHGRMESNSNRNCGTRNNGVDNVDVENMQYISPLPIERKGVTSLMPKGICRGTCQWINRTKLSFTFESGKIGRESLSPGWNFTGCAYTGSCRYTPEQYAENMQLCAEGNNFDWNYPSIIEAFGGDTGLKKTAFLEQHSDANYVFYNRGSWGKIEEDKARKVLGLLRNMTINDRNIPNDGEFDKNHRCFFRSTTGSERTKRNGLDGWEFGPIRIATSQAGCEFMDINYVTSEFSNLIFAHPRSPQKHLLFEYYSVFWDAVHYQP